MHQDKKRATTRILYAPVAGGQGSGEQRRCEAIIESVSRTNPCIRHALIGPVKPRVDGVQWFPLTTSPTRNPTAIVDAMVQFKPDWIGFDGNTRQGPLKFAKRAGIGTIFIASRPKGRRKALSPRRLFWLDWVWLVNPLPDQQALGWFESLMLKLCRRTSWRIWSSIHSKPDQDAAQRRLDDLGLKPGRYLLLCPGGGGQCVNGQPITALMQDVACGTSAITGWPALVVGCDSESHEHVHCIPQVSQSELLALVGYSRACLVGGGSLVTQALMEGGHCAAAGWQSEQRDRVFALAHEGLVIPADANVNSMSAALVKAACDGIERNVMRSQSHHRFSNGVEEIAAILATSPFVHQRARKRTRRSFALVSP